MFNPGINKQATEVYFSQRREKSLPPPIIFNNKVLTSPFQKHGSSGHILGLYSVRLSNAAAFCENYTKL